MQRKLSKEEFCNLANRNEELKQLKRAIRERQEKTDFIGFAEHRTTRVYKASGIW
ncbi:MAG: hypothetical protein N3I35_18680 [Clostridia bacterium]|nr:hypothetical protein [Clostridia bacterium]